MNNYILHAPEFIVVLIVWLMVGVYMRSRWMIGVAILYSVMVLSFFRGWRRSGVDPSYMIDDPNILYCPCDGVVKSVDVVEGHHIHIVIFLNVHNIHVQYAPADVIVKSIDHIPGSFHPAFMLQKSQYNERVEYVFHHRVFGDILFSQIAGQLARRIKTFVRVGQHVKALSPIGLIKLGSRCDIYIPIPAATGRDRRTELHVLAKINQRIHIGDQLAYFAR